MKTDSIDTKGKYVKMKHEEYEHLAKSFFETRKKAFPVEEKKKKSVLPAANLIIAGLVFVFIIGLFLFFPHARKEQAFSKIITVYSDKAPIYLRYNFTLPGSSKIATFSFGLNDLDVHRYRNLEISARTEKEGNETSIIKLHFENSRLENDNVYMKNISSHWKTQKIPLSNFKKITDWSSLKSISFMVEDWNAASKEDALIIDAIRFVE